ncbi:MAG: amino acid adenylation domain-containing protein [Dorea sp.]|nr:amino acid adenylation domain-containing protein [Dorea sp.]
MRNILEYLEESAGKFPDKTAFADETAFCTYSELRDGSRRIGAFLAERVVPESPIPVFMEKSVNAVYAFMGAVYAGCFYTLLEPKLPPERLKQVLTLLDAKVIITDSAYEKRLKLLEFQGEVIQIGEALQGSRSSDREKQGRLLDGIRKRHLDIHPLYAIFTSGSTGIPKGVLVSHRSVIDFIGDFTEMFGISSEDVIGNQAPFDFDVSVKDIYSALKTGATVQIVPKKLFSFPSKLLDYLEEKNVTTLIWAVSALCMISTLNGFDYKIPKQIKRVIFSGEVMPVKQLNIWRRHIPDALYVNVYGPTEITCNCTYYIVNREFGSGESIPIGRPFPNEKVFLLDEENREICEPEVKGELCVSGTALSLGYYRNPEQTAGVFVQNPLNTNWIEPIYRTGDMAYYGHDGELYFASRKDFQIKHMGHRIELGEIEAVMEGMKEIIRACCIYDEDSNKIVAFYKGGIDKKQAVRRMGQVLPGFMIPNKFCRVEEFPLTKNGKIDRRRLTEECLEDCK